MTREGDLSVTFHGVRGSTPCSCPSQQRYGGNTSCVSVEADGTEPIVLDLGTGVRQWGSQLGDTMGLVVHALVSHLHWDHVQGLPFFAPLQRICTTLNVYGPGDADESIAATFDRLMSPPFFPIQAAELPSRVVFHDLWQGVREIGGFAVRTASVPHTGPTCGYRLERGGVSVVYVPDHQQPLDRSGHVDEAVLELCRDADLLIHDAQYTPEQFAAKSTWGHCTIDYAVEVARQAGARTLVPFHHDPGHDDDELDALMADASERAASHGIEVIPAAEGLKIDVAAAL